MEGQGYVCLYPVIQTGNWGSEGPGDGGGRAGHTAGEQGARVQPSSPGPCVLRRDLRTRPSPSPAAAASQDSARPPRGRQGLNELRRTPDLSQPSDNIPQAECEIN